MNIPRIKICCIQSQQEAQLAIRYGASALGFVTDMPSGPGVLPEDQIAEIIAQVPPPIATFLLTCSQHVETILAQQRFCRANTLQLVDAIPKGAHRQLREALPGIRIVQVVHVTNPESLDEALALENEVDAILLDSGNPSLAVKELGGTGRVHDWEISRQICERLSKPVFLAGGLKPENVAQAVQRVQPFGLDICSGVRTEGTLDEEKLAGFIRNAFDVRR